jgi:hypothetical protein
MLAPSITATGAVWLRLTSFDDSVGSLPNLAAAGTARHRTRGYVRSQCERAVVFGAVGILVCVCCGECGASQYSWRLPSLRSRMLPQPLRTACLRALGRRLFVSR